MDHPQKVRRSMLWAAYGDALGFITELADEGILKRRIHTTRVAELIPWTRRLGGRFGIDIPLPRGCYSDDTQLRLATGRAIRGDGHFDVEAFARVELPVWRGYALGAGRGTRAAALALCGQGVQWCTNFFETKDARYLDGGGNGAAMRIQPHIWSSPLKDNEAGLLKDVIRNAITTHGHATAWVGASFHAICLKHAMATESIPNPADWLSFLEPLGYLARTMRKDDELGALWIPLWERNSRRKLEDAIREAVGNLRGEILIAKDALETTRSLKPSVVYGKLVESIGGLSPTTMGSATKTSVLAAFLAKAYQDQPIEGMRLAANTLGSDTDSIASMYGAIQGCLCRVDPPEPVMDIEYLDSEAQRLAGLCNGSSTCSFSYPDLLFWKPPSNMLDTVGKRQSNWVVSGLGSALPLGNGMQQRGNSPGIWQWFRLDFGQQVLAKRRERPKEMSANLLPFDGAASKEPDRKGPEPKQPQTTTREYQGPVVKSAARGKGEMPGGELSLEEATDRAIKSNFDPETVGAILLGLAVDSMGVDRAIAYAAIVSKAKIARMKRNAP